MQKAALEGASMKLSSTSDASGKLAVSYATLPKIPGAQDMIEKIVDEIRSIFPTGPVTFTLPDKTLEWKVQVAGTTPIPPLPTNRVCPVCGKVTESSTWFWNVDVWHCLDCQQAKQSIPVRVVDIYQPLNACQFPYEFAEFEEELPKPDVEVER